MLGALQLLVELHGIHLPNRLGNVAADANEPETGRLHKRAEHRSNWLTGFRWSLFPECRQCRQVARGLFLDCSHSRWLCTMFPSPVHSTDSFPRASPIQTTTLQSGSCHRIQFGAWFCICTDGCTRRSAYLEWARLGKLATMARNRVVVGENPWRPRALARVRRSRPRCSRWR